MFTVTAKPSISSFILGIIAILITLSLLCMGIFLFTKIIKATKDIEEIKKNTSEITKKAEKRD